MSSEGDVVGGPPQAAAGPDGPREPRDRREPGPHRGSPRYRRRILLATAVLGVAGIVGTGAAATGHGGAAPVRAGAHRTASPAGEPLREVTEPEADLLHTAEQILLRDCMRDRGFVYEPVPRQPVPDARDFPYVVDDPEWARRHGYGSDLDRKREEISTEGVNERYFRSLPQERRAPAIAAANGSRPDGLSARASDGLKISRSPDGCQSQAERGLYPDLAAWFQARVTVDSLPPLRGGQVIADGEFRGATRKWSVCMNAAGYAFQDPAAARAALPPPDRPFPREREVAMAVAEAGCARSSGLAETAARLDRKYDTELREKYGHDVTAWLRFRLDALPRARAVVEADAER